MGRVRKAYPYVKYKSKEIGMELNQYVQSFSVTENLQDSMDDLSITLRNDNNRFLKPEYCLEKKEKLEISIITENWENLEETIKTIPAGIYYIDDRSFSDTSVSIKGISGPIGNMQDQVNSKHWENFTLKKLGEQLAKKHKLSLHFIGEDLKFFYIEQDKETDLSFLKRVVNDEGMALKVNYNKIIIFDIEKLEEKKVVRVFDLKGSEIDQSSWNFREKTKEIYDICEISYLDINTGIEEKIAYGRDNKEVSGYEEKPNLKVLKISKKSLNRDIKIYAKKMLRRANRKEVEFNFNIIGDVSVMVGQTFQLINSGIFEGKYMISRVTKSLNPFKCEIESYKI